MRIQISQTAIEVEFVDGCTGAKKSFRLEMCEDGESVEVAAKTFGALIDMQERTCHEGCYRVSFSAAKAFCAALLLLEV